MVSTPSDSTSPGEGAERAYDLPRPEPLAPELGALRLAIAGGGTGGHVVPGLHLLDALHEGLDGVEGRLDDLLWFHSGRRAEDRCMAELDRHPAAPDLERIVLELEPQGGGALAGGRGRAAGPRAAARGEPGRQRARLAAQPQRGQHRVRAPFFPPQCRDA